MADYDVVVVGAGLGGLTAGALLAKQGRSVLVLEQSERIGGCCSTFEKDGYHFDVGASIIEVIYPIEVAFQRLGTTFQDEVDLIPCDPVMSAIFRDGSRITYPMSIEKTAEMLSQISPDDGNNFTRFAKYFSGLVKEVLEGFITRPASSLDDIVTMLKEHPGIIRYLPSFVNSYQDVIKRYFKNDRVLQTMAYQSLYFGLPPELVPGAFAMIPYTEHVGMYYPRGGMIQIPKALQRCGERHGMQVRMNQRVQKVMVRNRRAEGVVLADGTQITARLVVSNINAKTLYLDLIGEEHLPWLARVGVKSYELSKAVPMIYLGIDYEPPLDAHHSLIAVSMEEVNDYWWNRVKKGVLPDQEFGLICWPTHSDPSLAPKGRHVLNLIPEGFYRLKGTDWDKEKQPFVERVIHYLSSFAVPGLEEHVKVAECATPLDFERRLLLPEGAIYCLQEDLAAQAVFRPSAKSKNISGLYLTGSSTHPGGGVPTTIASGFIAAELIQKYEG